MNSQKKKHDSYALLSLSKVSHGKETELFGSSIKHNNTVRLSIKPAAVDRHLNTDRYYNAGREYIEVEMSYSQFAEAMVSMNQGEGIPCTLKYLNGKKIDTPTFDNKRLEFENEFSDKMKEIGNKLKQLTEEAEDILENKKTVNKGDRNQILGQIKSLHQEVNSNIPFFFTMFNEQMDKTVTEAKGEIEAFTQNKVNTLGMEKMDDLTKLK